MAVEFAGNTVVVDSDCPKCGAALNHDASDNRDTCAYCGYTRVVQSPVDAAVMVSVATVVPTDVSQCAAAVTESAAVVKESARHTKQTLQLVKAQRGFCRVCSLGIDEEQAKHLFYAWYSQEVCGNGVSKIAPVCTLELQYTATVFFKARVQGNYQAAFNSISTQSVGSTVNVCKQPHSGTNRYDVAVISDCHPICLCCSTEQYKKLLPWQGLCSEGSVDDLDLDRSVQDASAIAPGCWPIVESSIMARAQAALEAKIRGNYAKVESFCLKSMSADSILAEYGLCYYPIWMGTYQVAGKQYSFMINGSTGKVVQVGDSPQVDSPSNLANCCLIGCVSVIALVFFAIIISAISH